MHPVEPKPAASVVLVRPSVPVAAEPIEVYMIRRNRGMRFLGGYYAFPGGKVDPADAAKAMLERCVGLDREMAARVFDEHYGVPALAYWITAARELLEESGVLLACDEAGRPVPLDDPGVVQRVEEDRQRLVSGDATFLQVLESAGWWCDLRPLRYLSHFITPTSSPIRFTARFFICRVPPGQEPRLYTEETSEGFWILPGEGYRRFRAGEMAMAEPAEYGLGYVAQFGSLDELWAAHADGGYKFHGVIDRIDDFYSGRFDWKTNRWKA